MTSSNIAFNSDRSIPALIDCISCNRDWIALLSRL